MKFFFFLETKLIESFHFQREHAKEQSKARPKFKEPNQVCQLVQDQFHKQTTKQEIRHLFPDGSGLPLSQLPSIKIVSPLLGKEPHCSAFHYTH